MSNSDSDKVDSSGLGKRFIQQEVRIIDSLICIGISVFMVSFVILVPLRPGQIFSKSGDVVLCFALVAACSVAFCLGIKELWQSYGVVHTFHEHGVVSNRRGNISISLYSDIETMSCRNLIVYQGYNSTIPVGGIVRLRLILSDDSLIDCTFYRASRSADEIETVLRVMERITHLIASRMETTLERGESIDLARGITLVSTGLLISGRNGERSVGWTDIRLMRIEEEVFRLWVHGEKRACLKLSTSKPNVLPAIHLILARTDLPISPPKQDW
ncbi:hypothetical protein [Gemmata sp.]|uniref:hypothetical protein n=1 Tax=Gemmata sp. TaxID=1914242 RepID=UPI003F70AF38